MNTRKMKRHRNSDTQKKQQQATEPQQNYRIGTVSNELLGLGLNLTGRQNWS